jgi:hypothetical protein
MNHHHHTKKDCLAKRAFVDQRSAERSGQRAYRCPVCHYWHRTGPVTPVKNPVLRFSLVVLTILLILATAHGEVTVDYPVAYASAAIIQNMTARGYRQIAMPSNLVVRNNNYSMVLYFIYPLTSARCTEQKFKFILRLDNGYPAPDRTAIKGFAVCYTQPSNIEYDSLQLDKIILDAFKK